MSFIKPKIFYLLHLIILLMLFTAQPAFAESDYDQKFDEIERAVTNLPRGSVGIPVQWFEMETIIGWEKMMLILGYANNMLACERILILAREESPSRRFRCSPAN